MKTSKTDLFSFNGLLIVLFAIAIGIYLIVPPKNVIDLKFLSIISNWYFSREIFDIDSGYGFFKYGLPVDLIPQMWEKLSETENFRLANFILVIILLLPKWLGSGISLLIWFYCMMSSFKLAGVEIKKSPLVPAAIILWGIFIPWDDHMGALAFQLNYIWCTGIALFLISFLNIGKKTENKNHNFLWMTGFFILSFCTGWSHEGFSLSIIAGLVVLFLLSPDYRKKKYIVALSGLILGSTLIFLAGGTLRRISNEGNFTTADFLIRIRIVLEINIPYILFLASVSFFSLFRKKISIFKDPLIIFCLVNGIIPIVLSVLTQQSARTTWWTQIVAIIGLMHILIISGPSYWRTYKFYNMIWLLPSCFGLLLYWTICDINTCINRGIYNKSIESYTANPGKSIFGKIRTNKDYPIEFYNLPAGMIMNTFEFLSISEFYSPVSQGAKFAIIPAELQYVSEETGEAIDGISGARIYHGYVYIPASSSDLPDISPLKLEVDFGKGYVPVSGYLSTFTSDKDHKSYRYITINSNWFIKNFRTPKGIRITRLL